jgi:hypothetical protein
MKKRYRGKPILKYEFAVHKKYGFGTSLGVDRNSGGIIFPIIIQTNQHQISFE